MAGMHVYEWSFYGPEYVKALVPIAAPGKSSSWSMAWNEAQRQAIFADPNYLDGYYSLDAVSTLSTCVHYHEFGPEVVDNRDVFYLFVCLF